MAEYFYVFQDIQIQKQALAFYAVSILQSPFSHKEKQDSHTL